MKRLWLSGADATQRRTFWACFAGWSLDAFDSQLFGLAIPTLITAFGLTRGEAGLISGLTIGTAALGGWLGGALSDRVGRVRAMQISIGWFAIGSLLTAVSNGPAMLAIVKSIQGFGFGAEWAIGAALISEVMSKDQRGRAMGAVQSGWALGWGAAVLANAVIVSLWPPDEAWRVLFGVGAAPALFVLVLQGGLRDLPKSEAPSRAPWMSSAAGIFRRENLRTTLAGSLVGLGAHAGYYGLFTWLPTYLSQERRLNVMAAGAALGVIIFAFALGCLTSGQLADRFGRRRTITAFALSCILVLAVYMLAPIGANLRLLLGFLLGFSAAGVPASLGTLFSELYPDKVKGAGVGFCYNAGRIVSAFAPFLIGRLGEHAAIGPLIALIAGGAYALVVVALHLLPKPETSPALTASSSAGNAP